jgi:N-methylhydantoinase A/oxoprolinase/acetone carboxylase beta subunit
MIRALRVMTVERGVDPRALALMAFGGAGGLHAAAIAQELGITRILCPRASGVLAALGLVVSERRRDVQRSVLLAGEALTTEAIRRKARALAEQAGHENVRHVAELRYRGQAFELSIELGDPDADALRQAFHAAHERAYGYSDPQLEVELVTLRATATTPGATIDADAQGTAQRARRRTILGDTEVIRGEPAPGETIAGPAVVELPEATLAVPEGWAGEVLSDGTIRIEWTR